MDWLNYHHFLYFWLIVREGGILPAAKRLRLAHSTVSTQLKQLEEQLGEPLFDRSGRKFKLTEAGKLAYQYAEEIFPLGQEFLETLKGQPSNRPLRLRVGVTEVLPKLVVRRLLAPALELSQTVRLICEESDHRDLLGQLASHQLDLVLADAPLPPGTPIKAFNHLLGESGVTFFATPERARVLKRKFPKSLHGAPFLMPGTTSSIRTALEQWFEEQDIVPLTVAEFADSALLKVMGQDGYGAFCVPTVTEKDVREQYNVVPIGRSKTIRERFYAISIERRIKNPAAQAICEGAKKRLFR